MEYISNSKENNLIIDIKVEVMTDQDNQEDMTNDVETYSPILQVDIIKRENNTIEDANTEINCVNARNNLSGKKYKSNCNSREKINLEENITNQINSEMSDVNAQDNCTRIYGNKYDVVNKKKCPTIQEDYIDFNAQDIDVIDDGIDEDASKETYLSCVHEGLVECKLETYEDINIRHLNKDSLNGKTSSSIKQGNSPSSLANRQKANTSTIKFKTNVDFPDPINNKLSCDLCHYETTQERQLMSHMKAHAANRSFNCNICSYKTIRKDHLKLHMKTHAGEKSYPCPHCTKAFISKSALQKHSRTHSGERPFACNVCEKRFAAGASLRSHLRVHTGEKPFSCKFCKRKFSERSSLRKHVRLHTGEKPLKCDICKKSLNEAALNTDGKKYFCDICLKSIKNTSAIKIGLSVHQQKRKVKSFCCEDCGKMFSRKSLHRNHMRTQHSNEKPYSCQVCLKAFSYMASLRKHMKLHTDREDVTTA